MPRPPIDLTRKIKDILRHTQPLPDEAKAPILHYRRTGTDIWASLAYVERAFDQPGRHRAVREKHLGRLYGMAMVSLVEAFERFLKEVAAECVDFLADLAADDRFDVFKIQASNLASHFRTGTLGKSLCEGVTWLDVEDVNKRFRDLLSDPFQDGTFWLFPKKGQQPEAERWRFEPLTIVFQLRNTSVHNVGVITQSDAVKLRLLARETVSSPRLLVPTRQDLTYLKRFLDETADSCNGRIGTRLAQLLTFIHGDTPGLLDPTSVANRLTASFQSVLAVAEAVGVLPPD
jgi:hypothetical protein